VRGVRGRRGQGVSDCDGIRRTKLRELNSQRGKKTRGIVGFRGEGSGEGVGKGVGVEGCSRSSATHFSTASWYRRWHDTLQLMHLQTQSTNAVHIDTENTAHTEHTAHSADTHHQTIRGKRSGQ
jgi:hypothetical protein